MFSEYLTATIILFILVIIWLDFFKAIGKVIWFFRIPITVAAILYIGDRILNWIK